MSICQDSNYYIINFLRGSKLNNKKTCKKKLAWCVLRWFHLMQKHFLRLTHLYPYFLHFSASCDTDLIRAVDYKLCFSFLLLISMLLCPHAWNCVWERIISTGSILDSQFDVICADVCESWSLIEAENSCGCVLLTGKYKTTAHVSLADTQESGYKCMSKFSVEIFKFVYYAAKVAYTQISFETAFYSSLGQSS